MSLPKNIKKQMEVETMNFIKLRKPLYINECLVNNKKWYAIFEQNISK